jgi:DNA-binding transcriptional MerR regulator
MSLRIGELAQRTGLAPSRIRFYERIGLLQTVERQANGYRSYPADAELVLKLIVTAQQAGFSLDDLRTLMPSGLTQLERGTLLDTLRRKVRDIEVLQAQLAQSKRHLVKLIAQIEAKPEDMSCAENARRMLSTMPVGEATKARAAEGRARQPRSTKARTPNG